VFEASLGIGFGRGSGISKNDEKEFRNILKHGIQDVLDAILLQCTTPKDAKDGLLSLLSVLGKLPSKVVGQKAKQYEDISCCEPEFVVEFLRFERLDKSASYEEHFSCCSRVLSLHEAATSKSSVSPHDDTSVSMEEIERDMKDLQLLEASEQSHPAPNPVNPTNHSDASDQKPKKTHHNLRYTTSQRLYPSVDAKVKEYIDECKTSNMLFKHNQASERDIEQRLSLQKCRPVVESFFELGIRSELFTDKQKQKLQAELEGLPDISSMENKISCVESKVPEVPKAVRSQLQRELEMEFLSNSSIDGELDADVCDSVVRRLQRILSTFHESAVIKPHGSVASNLASESSDVDLVISGWQRTKRDYEDHSAGARSLLKTYKSSMLRNGIPFSDITPLLSKRIRVPIIKLVEPVSGLECDVSCAEEESFHHPKAELLRRYTEIDARVRPLVRMIKYWSKSNGIGDASKGYLNQFGWVLLVVQHLQTTNPPILPALQRRSKEELTQIGKSHQGLFGKGQQSPVEELIDQMAEASPHDSGVHIEVFLCIYVYCISLLPSYCAYVEALSLSSVC